jgi:tetratricopeptide (TPR) repeat protein
MAKSLPQRVHDEISRLSEEGNRFAELGDDTAALQKYKEAWDLIPEDKENWEASTWILATTGEVFFRQNNFEKALTLFLRAVQGPNGLGNPYIHLRIGQLQFESGNMQGAGDNLTRAYMGAGEQISEKEDPKYLTFLRSILLPPLTKGD